MKVLILTGEYLGLLEHRGTRLIRSLGAKGPKLFTYPKVLTIPCGSTLGILVIRRFRLGPLREAPLPHQTGGRVWRSVPRALAAASSPRCQLHRTCALLTQCQERPWLGGA